MNTKKIPSAKSNEPFHMRHRNFLVGLFVFVPIIIIPVLLVYSLSKSELGEKWIRHITVTYDKKTGLSKSSSIMFQGYEVARMEDVSLNEVGHIVVTFRIKQRYKNLIRKDSKAMLSQKSMFVGDPEIELTKGSDSAGELKDGDTLQPGYPPDISGTISQLTDVVVNLQSITKGIAEGKGTVGQLLANDTLFRQLLRDTKNLDRTLAGVDGMIRNLDKTVVSFSEMGKSTTTLVDSLSLMMKQVGGLMANVNTLVSGVQQLPADVQKTMTGVQRDLAETETILKALQKHWLIRKQVKQVKEESGSR
jgi:phospholipid/cholesterol/gamma-HCH transport system substrate-binding protein